MNRIIVTAINDNPKYQDYLTTFLASITHNAPAEYVRCWAVNCPQSFCVKMRKIHPKLDITNPRRKKFGKAAASHIRSEMIPIELAAGVKQGAWIDNDTIIRAPLDGLFEGVVAGTLRVTHRPWQDAEKRKFQDGVYVLGNSGAVAAMMDRMRRKLKKHTEWYDDQHQLYKCWRKYSKRVKLQNLPRTFNDNHFGPESVIWHCNMKDKNRSQEFNADRDMYRALAESRVASFVPHKGKVSTRAGGR